MTWKNSQFRKKTTKAVKKRYGIGKGQGGFKFSQVAKDLAWVKSRLNVEKKLYVGAVTSADVGQVDQNNFGYYSVDLTPSIFQGDGESQRVGNSLKFTGFNQKIQFIGQRKCFTTRRLKIHFIKTTDTTSSVENIINDVYDQNPLTGLVDYHSERNYANNKKAHRVVMKRNYTVRASSGMDVDTATGAANSRPLGDMNISMKMNDVCRFPSDSSNSIQDYRIIMVIFCDTGNRHPSNASINTGCLIPGSETGLDLQHHYRFWYVDN